MKAPIPLLFIALVFANSAIAAELTLELPKTTWVLQQGSPPLQQREGQVLPAENETVQKMLPLLNERKPEAALQQIKVRYPDLMEQLEAGDPKGTVRERVVTGDPFSPPRNNGISATMLYLIGNAYVAAKNYNAAEVAFKTALNVMPDFIRIHESYGLMLLVTERYKEALRQLSRAAQLGLNTPNLFGALGYANDRLDNHFGAVSGYQMAMMLEPDNEQWQLGLLTNLTSSKQYSSGLAFVDQLLNTRPNDAELWIYRSSLQLEAGNKQQGLDSLEAAIRLGNDSLANLQVCASLHMEIGSVERAVSLLKTGMGKGLEFRFVDQSLGWLAAHEQWSPMQKLLDETNKNQSGLSDVQQSRVLLHRASFSLHNNESVPAKNNLQQAITLDPANAEALLALGQLYHKEKNYGQAELLLQRASASPAFKDNALLLLAQVAIDQHNYTRGLQILRSIYAANPGRADLARNISTLEDLEQLENKN